MHARAVAALFAALGCANAWAANEADKPAFDCARAKNAAERMICADRSLAALDQRLARLYADTLALAFDRERLRASQLAWLRERDKCSTGDCIRTAYEQRIEAIEHSGEMTDTRAAAICTTVVQAINDGSIVSQFIAMDPESEGDRQRWAAGTRKDESLNGVKRLSIHGRARTFSLTASAGSCSSYSIGDMDAKVPYREPADAENDERLRWSSWGYDDHLMIVEGEPIVLTGGFGPQRWRGTLVSWIGTDGTTRPLCALDLSRRIETRILRAGDAALCAAAASGKVQAVAWEKSGVAIDDASRNAQPMHVDAYQSARVDVDLDGKSDTIIRFEYASGAKCGSFHQWLRYAERVAASAPEEPRPEYSLPEPEGAADVYTLPDSALGRAVAAFGGPIGANEGDDDAFSLKIFSFAGKAYVLARGTQSSAAVVSLWGAKPRIWCEFDLRPQHEVATRYPVAP